MIVETIYTTIEKITLKKEGSQQFSLELEFRKTFQRTDMANFIKLAVFCYIGKHSKTLAFS